jgi:DNA-binding MarR family transcriptional regulator
VRKNSVVYHIGRIRRRINRFLEQELKQHRADDLVVSQGAILATLYQHREKLTMKAIAAIVRRDKSTVTYLIDKLIDLGYVIKCPCEQDGRVIFIELTDKAHQFEETFNAISTRLIEKVYTGLTEAEAVELERLLEKVEQNFEEFA